ncbi:hypothetical protein COLO4_38604 [Corchorus olitorius]|uniref:Uncharacterized protein n=1 Tax=Corchorus olitorius TaxID=93759 RepID=A0A1R3FU01_9ROSI|nr:hypothetical protein COLO4_38604 [Corchorus olitorius]
MIDEEPRLGKGRGTADRKEKDYYNKASISGEKMEIPDQLFT